MRYTRLILLFVLSTFLVAACSGEEIEEAAQDTGADLAAMGAATGQALAVKRCGVINDGDFSDCETTDSPVPPGGPSGEDFIESMETATTPDSFTVTVTSSTGTSYTYEGDLEGAQMSCEGDGLDCEGGAWNPTEMSATMQQVLADANTA